MPKIGLGIELEGHSGRAPAPTAPLAGATAWYDFADLSTLWQDAGATTPVASDGDLVGRVDNKGSISDFLRVRGGYDRFTYGAGLFGSLGGLILRRNDTTPFPSIASGVALASGYLTDVAFTMYHVWSLPTGGSSVARMNTEGHATFGQASVAPGLEARCGLYSTGGGNQFAIEVDPHGFGYDTPLLVVSQWDGETLSVWGNDVRPGHGASIAYVDTPDAQNFSQPMVFPYVDGTPNIDDYVGHEVLLYAAVHDQTARTFNARYLQGRWGLDLAF